MNLVSICSEPAWFLHTNNVGTFAVDDIKLWMIIMRPYPFHKTLLHKLDTNQFTENILWYDISEVK